MRQGLVAALPSERVDLRRSHVPSQCLGVLPLVIHSLLPVDKRGKGGRVHHFRCHISTTESRQLYLQHTILPILVGYKQKVFGG